VNEAVVLTSELAAGYDGRPAIADVTVDIQRGERVALLGPNGGGKTTLFRALLGELRPLAGTLDVRVRAGTVPQTDRSRLDYPVTALDVAVMGALSRLPWWRRPGRQERHAAHAALDRVGLGDRAHDSFGEMSGGQRQRTLVARALVQDAELLLLDEPFVGLDSPSTDQLARLLDDLARGGRAVIVATHDLDQARGYDRVLCLNRRQIAFGEPRRVLDRDVLESTYGAQIVELPSDDGHHVGVVPAHHCDHEHEH
jgi:ABC-type Mn2+/Zn2+ transport system ATPase subunit